MPLSLNSLREDLDISQPTVARWMDILEKFYFIFRLLPFGGPKIRAVKKEQKLYLWDWARIEKLSAKFENLVAVHLLRFQHWCEDILGERIEIRYFRDTVGHEVDFIVLRNRKPWMAIEVKESDHGLDSNLKYLLHRVKIPYAFQLSLRGEKDYRVADINGCKIRIMPALRFLIQLP